MWAQNLLPSLFQTFIYVKFACDHAPLIRFVIRPAGHGAITPARQCKVISYIRSIGWYSIPPAVPFPPPVSFCTGVSARMKRGGNNGSSPVNIGAQTGCEEGVLFVIVHARADVIVGVLGYMQFTEPCANVALSYGYVLTCV